jgi:hypothetical protein
MSMILSVADNSKSIPMWVDLAQYVEVFKKYIVDAALGNITPEDAQSKIKAETAKFNFTDMRAELK